MDGPGSFQASIGERKASLSNKEDLAQSLAGIIFIHIDPHVA